MININEMISELDYIDSLDKDEFSTMIISGRLNACHNAYEDLINRKIDLIADSISRKDIYSIGVYARKLSKVLSSSYNKFIESYIEYLKTNNN